MARENTKQQILEAALELFSEKGFEASSMSEIADTVGIKKASLYCHYTNKQDILDKLIDVLKGEYDRNSIFADIDWDNPAFIRAGKGFKPDDISEMIKKQIKYIINAPYISKIRKLLIIEQFRNPALKKLLFAGMI